MDQAVQLFQGISFHAEIQRVAGTNPAATFIAPVDQPLKVALDLNDSRHANTAQSLRKPRYDMGMGASKSNSRLPAPLILPLRKVGSAWRPAPRVSHRPSASAKISCELSLFGVDGDPIGLHRIDPSVARPLFGFLVARPVIR